MATTDERIVALTARYADESQWDGDMIALGDYHVALIKWDDGWSWSLTAAEDSDIDYGADLELPTREAAREGAFAALVEEISRA